MNLLAHGVRPQNEGLSNGFRADCERVNREWDECAKALDTEGLLALYSEDAVLERPLVPAILDDKEDGVLRGHDELRRFFAEGGPPMIWCAGTVPANGLPMVAVSWSGNTRARRQTAIRSTLSNSWRSLTD